MLIDVRLRPRDAGRGAHDAQLYPMADRRFIARLYPRDAARGVHDVQLRPENLLVAAAAGSFPTQYAGLRVYYGGSVRELCLVAEADAPAGMGGVIKVQKGGIAYVAYLVETSDPDASSVRVRTSTATKSVRLKT